MKRSPSIGPLTYIGPEWSFLAILGKQNYKTLFKEWVQKEEPLDGPHNRAYQFFFEGAEGFKFLYHQTLSKLKAEGGSLIAHSAIFDHMNHGIFRANPGNTKYLKDLGNRICNDLNSLKHWIDSNPDYLLILSSDHGTGIIFIEIFL